MITQFNTDKMPSVIAKKLEGLVNVLNDDKICLKKVKAFLAEGIPDEAAIIR